MSFTQDLVTSRRNYTDGNVRVGELDRLWYDSNTNTLRIGDGITQGGRPITSSMTDANIGDLVIYGTTISTLGPLQPITIQADNGGNINLVGVTQVRGNSIFYDLAEFYGGILLASDLDAAANLHVAGTLIVEGTTQAKGTFTANGLSYLIGNVIMSGTTQTIGTFVANGNVIMSGTSALIGNVTITGNSDVLGTSSVQGVFTANGATHITGNTTVTGYMEHTGDTLFVGNVQHTGNLHVGGFLEITRNTTHQGNLTVIGDTSLTGNTNMIGPFYVSGDTLRTGNVTDNGTRIQNGPMTINNQLSLTGLGNVKFNDGTIQTTAAIEYIQNAGHITGAYVFSLSQCGLSLTSDATPNNIPSTIVSRDGNSNIAVGNITAATINTTVVGGNNSIAGSMIVYGNLQVLGTTTTISANVIALDTKVIIVSNSAVTSSQADASGLQVGNTTVFGDFLFDNDQQAWRTGLSIVPTTDSTGNIGSETRHWNWIHSDNVHIDQKLIVGIHPEIDNGSAAQFTSNVDSYSQIIHQNISTNSHASTDFVAQADNGDADTNYIDLGINSSTYNAADYTIGSANDGYLYVNGGDLSLGTQTVGTDVVFHTDGTVAANEAGRIHLGRWILGGAVDDGVTRMQIGDGLRVVANITAGNVFAQNITDIATSVTTANTAMKGYVDSQDTTISNSVTGANAAIVTANTAMKGYVDAANTIQSNQINTLSNSVTGANAAIVTANTAMKGYVDAANTIQSNQINAIQGNVYGNANVAAYLPIYSGNIAAGNATITSRVTAGTFAGDGGLLTNISLSASQTVGTWTPLITFSSGGTATYIQHSGEYIKSGRSVTAYFTIQISATAGASGTVRIGNLPVTSTTVASTYSGGVALDNYTFATMPSHVTGSVPSASSYCDLFWHDRSGSVNTLTAMTTTNLGTTATLIGRITYISAT